MRIHRVSASIAASAISLSLLVAGVASAQGAFSMTGKAATGSGLFVRLPAVGNTPCPSITAATTYNPQIMAGGMNVVMNPVGCIPGGPAVVNVNGTGGFTFPVNFFNQPPPGMLNIVPVPNTPMVVQLATSFGFAGPPPAPVDPVSGQRNVNMATPTFAYAPWRVMKHGAWMSQTGRLASDFTACPKPPGALACTNPNQAVLPGGGGGYVKNNATGGGFGGTWGLVLSSGGLNVSSLAQAIPIGPYMAVLNVPLAGMGSRAAGRGYGAFDTDVLGSGPIYAAYMLTGGGGPSAIISMVTPPILGVLPVQINRNWGFAWTTGTIVVRGTGMAPYGQPAGGTFSLQGFDNRTAMGAGAIQLVAGGVAQSTSQGPNGTPNYTVLRLNLPEPGAAAQLFAAVLGLLAIAAWRARTR
jgi:hypothetical protein